jgi:hypothetical protein
MQILQCEKCGSYLISIDMSTGKTICNSCKSDSIELISDQQFIKQHKRLQHKIDVFGNLNSPEDDEPSELD